MENMTKETAGFALENASNGTFAKLKEVAEGSQTILETLINGFIESSVKNGEMEKDFAEKIQVTVLAEILINHSKGGK